METYVYVKALHIIFVVTWFAALFYMPRLLIYHAESDVKPEPERTILNTQLKLMQRRLWNAIAWPSMALTWIFGLWMLVLNQMLSPEYQDNLLTKPWFILKLAFVFMLSLYHLKTHFIFTEQQRDEIKWSSFKLRLWNEVATVFLFAIIFLAIPKPTSGWVWGILGLILFIVAVFGAVAIYKANREKKEKPGKENQPPPIPPAL